MTFESVEGGRYFIHVDETNQSVYVSWTLSNDVIGIDDENPYYFFYELWDDKTVRFTHPVPVGSGCGGCGCGPGNAIFFTDHPISISIDGVKYYYLYDGLGSVTELIDANENVVNFYRYTPFGDALIRQETVYNPHQFTGRQYDAESGLYHYRARAYSPDIGRFMQQDPAGMVDGANMYAYCGNDPVNGVDPSGKILWRQVGWYWAARLYTDTQMRIGNSFRAHFALGCEIGRANALYREAHDFAYDIEDAWYYPGVANPDDAKITLWGWHYQYWGGIGPRGYYWTCYNMALYFIPVIGDTSYPRMGIARNGMILEPPTYKWYPQLPSSSNWYTRRI